MKSGVAPVALGIALLTTPAFAQDAQSNGTPTVAGQSDEARAAAGEGTNTGGADIIVTGSRIASPTITSVSPVQVVSEAQIDQAGVTNIQDLLLENPAFGSPTFSRTNTAFLTSGTGIASVDLRNLGTDRTLVLINGRRVVAGVPGSVTVDLNVIPTQFIQRIDVLTGGASSLYGSDAVAGVVNFIYKDTQQVLRGRRSELLPVHPSSCSRYCGEQRRLARVHRPGTGQRWCVRIGGDRLYA